MPGVKRTGPILTTSGVQYSAPSAVRDFASPMLRVGTSTSFVLAGHRGDGCQQPYVMAEAIEASVSRLYANIQLEPDRIANIRSSILKELDRAKQSNSKEARRQRTRLAKHREERTKLLHAHYAGAVPLDLLKSEQERISDVIAEAQRCLAAAELKYQDIEQTLKQALALVADCQRMYGLAPNHIRRQFNQAFFERIMVDEGEVTNAYLAQPFAQLLAHDLERRSSEETASSSASFFGQSSNEKQLVTLMGLYATKRGERPRSLAVR
jgi:hypothetical protein